MEYLFFDTSALVKRYHEEEGSEKVDRMVDDKDTYVIITSLCVIEATSAFRRKHNRGEVSEDMMNRLLSFFFEEALEDFLILPLEESLTEHSFDLILAEDLRTLDSLQLSAALAVRQEELVFVSADEKLNTVAENQGLGTFNPCQS